ncbi:hypothetical protein [uncultured Ferrimonas sp.]|nr:hypothetical protein [uncultured Ferrimonas sp.]
MTYMGPDRRKDKRRAVLERRGDQRWLSEVVDRRIGPGRRLADVPKTLTR